MIERSRAAAARIFLRPGLSQFATGLALKPRSFAGAIMRRIFVTKPVVAAQCLAMLIYTVRDGISATDKSRELRESCAAKPDAPKPGPPLTSRENEVMAWLAKGFLDKEIAGQLGISFSAVRFHLHNIYQKLPAGNRTEAVIKAWDTIHR